MNSESMRRMGHEILVAMNEAGCHAEANRRITGLMKAATGAEAVGIRLKDGLDYPYFFQDGFPQDFLEKENSLVVRTREGGICRDDAGNVCLECTCGMVIAGATEATRDIFTAGGSLATGDSAASAAALAGDDPRRHPRNECVHRGYTSVALVPIRAAGRNVGLIQLTSPRPDAFPSETVDALESVADTVGEGMLRMQADEILVANERFLRMLTDNIPGLVGYWTDGLRCGYANKAYLEWFGRTPERMIGTSMQELLGEAQFREIESHVAGALRGEPQQFERTIRKPSGEIGNTWAQYIPDAGEDGRVRGFYVLISDVTGLRHAEEELKESLLLNRRIIENAQEGITVHDRDLAYRVWNPFMEKLTGVPASEVIGRHPLECFPHLRESGALAQLEAALAGGAPPAAEYPFQVARTGKSGWTYNTTAPLRSDRGEIIGVIRTLSDVTGHRRLEEQLRQSQKMEALGKLAGGVAHDFNNALQIIMGFSSLLAATATADQKEAIQEIVSAAKRAAELTGGLLSYSRKQIFRLEPVDLNGLATGVEKFVRRILGEDVVLSVTAAPGPLVAIVDAAHVQQVFVNLATNARDAMPSGGSLSVRLDRVEIDERFVREQGVGSPGAFARVTVSDTGEGIPAEHLQRIFEPFFTTKPDGKGTGLGLSIVYGIVTQHRGFLTCESAPGEGTTFRVHLPLAEGCAETAGEPDAAPRVRRAGATVLLVEDDPGVRRIVRSLLTLEGHDVIEAASGAEAAEIFGREHGRIRLAIVDAVMPGMNGVETIASLRAIGPCVAAMIMSGYSREELGSRMNVPDDIGFVAKPVSPPLFAEAVDRALAGAGGATSR